MIELDFTLKDDFIKAKCSSMEQCVNILKEYAPKEPLLGALSLTINRTVPLGRKGKTKFEYATTFAYADDEVVFLKKCMLGAGFFYNISQVTVQYTECKYGKTGEFHIKLQALEMIEDEFTQKKT